jgi:hypothetical protein
MASDDLAQHPNADLDPILDDLRRREPIFHRPEFPTVMSEDYWEVGASGRRYNRDFILKTLAQHPPIDANLANWRATEFKLQKLAPGTYLLTYALDQAGRTTRRSTLWQKTAEDWQVLYHQGTITNLDDRTAPPQS